MPPCRRRAYQARAAQIATPLRRERPARLAEDRGGAVGPSPAGSHIPPPCPLGLPQSNACAPPFVNSVAAVATNACAPGGAPEGRVRQAMKIPEGLRLYRGMAGGLALPECFARADRRGRRGFLEFGFLSATTRCETAAHFSGTAAGAACATVLEIQPDAINCGASVAAYSQYPGAALGAALGAGGGGGG